MVILNGELIDAGELVEMAGRLTSFNTNRILKSDTSIFINEQYSGADDFTDTSGVKNTVDITDSTADYFDTDTTSTNKFYETRLVDEATGDTLENNGFTDPGNAVDGDTSTFAFNLSITGNVSLGRTFSTKTVQWVRIRASINNTNSSEDGTIKIQTFNGSTWDDEATLLDVVNKNTEQLFDARYFLNSSVQGIRIHFVSTNADAVNNAHRLYLFEYGTMGASSTVETDIIMNDIVPKSIVVYGETELPTNTSITVDVSDDGGSTFSITAQELDSYIDTTSFSGSDLALRFNLNTTDTAVTPFIKGYGVSITDS